MIHDTCTSYFLCSLFLYYRLIRVSLGKYVPKGEICHVYVGVSESNINTPYSKNRRSILENRTHTHRREFAR